MTPRPFPRLAAVALLLPLVLTGCKAGASDDAPREEPSSAAASEASSDAPTALIVDTTGAPLDGTDIEVHLWPDEATERTLSEGGGVPTFVVPESFVTVDRSTVTVALNPGIIPEENIEDEGKIHVEVLIMHPEGTSTGYAAQSVQLLDAPDGPLWVDTDLAASPDSEEAQKLIASGDAQPARLSAELTARTPGDE